MINFLRIVNNIKLGDYLHQDGTIDDKVSSDIVGICVIPSNFLPDNYARFMSLKCSLSYWENKIPIDIGKNYNKNLPGLNYEKEFGYLGSEIVSPFDNYSFNPDYLREIKGGNAFQDYKGYETSRIYKKKYTRIKKDNAFITCFRISPSYKKDEWYLPAIGELACIPPKFDLVKIGIGKAFLRGSLGSDLFLGNSHWSSTERIDVGRYAFSIILHAGFVYRLTKDSYSHVRAFLSL